MVIADHPSLSYPNGSEILEAVHKSALVNPFWQRPMLAWDNLIVAFRGGLILCSCFEFFREWLVIEEYPRILQHISLLSLSRIFTRTWYFLFHLYSNCLILCIIPSSSEFRTRLINAAWGRPYEPTTDNWGRTLFDTAYLLLEFSPSHRIGSGRFLSVAGRMGRACWNVDNECTSWTSSFCFPGIGTNKTKVKTAADTIKTAIRRPERLSEWNRQLKCRQD